MSRPEPPRPIPHLPRSPSAVRRPAARTPSPRPWRSGPRPPTTPTAGAGGWTTVTPAINYTGSLLSYALSSGDGTKTVYAWYKDAAGNVSAAASASILLDQTAPTNGALTPTASSGQITLNWT